nr:glycosyltransferase family 39 protein [Chloroflexota bacterium]
MPDRSLLTWTLLVKLGVLVIGFVALWVATGSAPRLLEPWDRWDAPHYTDIAVFGYMANDPGTLSAPGYSQVYPGDLDLYIVFFPLFPWLVAAVNAFIGAPVVAAFAVATVASLFVAPILYRLVAADCGGRIGLWSAGFLLIFPTAYFLHIGYTESLFLALAFGSMWLARTDRWWGAGLLGGLAALSRVNGLVLIPALMVEAYLQWR